MYGLNRIIEAALDLKEANGNGDITVKIGYTNEEELAIYVVEDSNVIGVMDQAFEIAHEDRDFPTLLREERERADCTLEQYAELAMLPAEALAEIENGETISYPWTVVEASNLSALACIPLSVVVDYIDALSVEDDADIDDLIAEANSQLIGLAAFIKRQMQRQDIDIATLAARAEMSEEDVEDVLACRDLADNAIVNLAIGLNAPIEILIDLMQDDNNDED